MNDWFKNKIMDEQNEVRDFDYKRHPSLPRLAASMSGMAFQAGRLGKAVETYSNFLDEGGKVIYSLAGSIFSAGMRKVVIDAIEDGLVHCIVCTGALMEQDILMALGHKHYHFDVDNWMGSNNEMTLTDSDLNDMNLDRVWDHVLDEQALQQVDMFAKVTADKIMHSRFDEGHAIIDSNLFLRRVAESLPETPSVIKSAYRCNVPIYVPALNDCAIGVGLGLHTNERIEADIPRVVIDSVLDFVRYSQWVSHAEKTGIVFIGGGVPKNYSQDGVIMAEFMGLPSNKHEIGIQISVADTRDGGLSGSTIKEAITWGKSSHSITEHMIWGEASTLFPILVGSVYWAQQKEGDEEE
jgi:deoxyhypusine synthase